MITRPKGLPKTGGRVKGVPNKKTVEIREQVAKICNISAEGLGPVEFMMKVYQTKGVPLGIRLDAAKSAAPYKVARLQPVDPETGKADQTVKIVGGLPERLSK